MILEAEQQELMQRIAEVVERGTGMGGVDNGDGFEVVERAWREE
jgi:hypothetical protein